AIGTKKWQIYASLLFETMFLLFFGCAFGFLLSEILCFVSSFLSFSFVPAFDIFLVNGYLKPILSVSSTCNLIFVILLFSLLAVGWAVHKSVNVMPVKALATTE
ncbi:MAG: FtsX-like permease family protein, partial [Treponema sp.]|nr:FtsX-like permease family protein [Treponema sp.]